MENEIDMNKGFTSNNNVIMENKGIFLPWCFVLQSLYTYILQNASYM